ncbi:MAG: hypothetical protein IJM90_02110 [Firmicutes bacterium]|nr:hypothetical protein [Bacillota bacterium]
MSTSLVIMAAGMGSRYGGNKQTDSIGPNGEILMEYSIYDALEAGFDKVVFIIKPEMKDSFKEKFGDKIAKRAEVAYAFQSFDSVPDFYQIPEDRVKPFGTGHALLCAKDVVNEPFAVLNADDYYGKTAFKSLYEELQKLAPSGEATMVGYRLRNTVSENGYVTRGVCSVADGKLQRVTETYKIKPFPDGTIRDVNYNPEGDLLDPDVPVSMNFWGFTPWFFTRLAGKFPEFLKGIKPGDIKAEFLLPEVVDELMKAGELTTSVLTTDAVWFGVTYHEDKEYVQHELLKLHARGDYPEKLFD